MPLYTTFNDIKARIAGKVNISDDPNDVNEMSRALLRRLVDEAEGEVELDLSPRYTIPFMTDTGAPFSQLPERPTKEILRTLCELKAVVRILETDFGSGSVISGSEYADDIRKRYQAVVDKLLQTHPESLFNWKFPPLNGLKVAVHNIADDGFAGQILVSSTGQGDYPSRQINSPAETLWNVQLDDLDRGW